MFATGAVLLPFFSFMTYLIAVPTGIKFFNWIGTMWKGQLTFETPMAVLHRLPDHLPVGWTDRCAAGQPAAGLPRHDSYFVVAHFHYVLFGTIVFSTFAGIYFWFPKMTAGCSTSDSANCTLVDVHRFPHHVLVQHWLGDKGMPRRYADYLPTDGFQGLNIVSTVGAFILGASMFPFVWNVFKSWRYGEVVTVDDPWGYATRSSGQPVARRRGTNFTELPASVRSVRVRAALPAHGGTDARGIARRSSQWPRGPRRDQTRRRQRPQLMAHRGHNRE